MISSLALALSMSAPVDASEIAINTNGHATNPSWSLSGQYLAFEMNTFAGQIDLFVAKIQNGNLVGEPQQVKLPGASSSFGGGGTVAVSPQWHPQGRLIFEGNNKGSSTRLFDWAPGGSAATELLSTAQIQGDLAWPSIRFDGGAVAFTSSHTGQGDVYIWDRASNKVSQAFTSPFSESGPRYDHASSLAYSRKNAGSEDIFVFKDGKSVPQAGGNGDQTRPTWVGATVVFFSNERGDDKWDIVTSAGAGQKVTIARDVRLPDRAPPALTPDKQWVVYGLADPDRSNRIVFTKVDGSQTVEIESELVACGEPAIALSGGRWFLAYSALPSQGSDWRRLHVVDVTGRL